MTYPQTIDLNRGYSYPMVVCSALSALSCLTALLSICLSPADVRRKLSTKVIFLRVLSDFLSACSTVPGEQFTGTSLCWICAFGSNTFQLAGVFWTVHITRIIYFMVVLGVPAHRLDVFHLLTIYGASVAFTVLPLAGATFGAPNKSGLHYGYCWVIANERTNPGWMIFFWQLFSFYFWLYASVLYILILFAIMLRWLRHPDSVFSASKKDLVAVVYRLRYYPTIVIACWIIPTIYDLSDVSTGSTFLVAAAAAPCLQGFATGVCFWLTSPDARFRLSNYIFSSAACKTFAVSKGEEPSLRLGDFPSDGGGDPGNGEGQNEFEEGTDRINVWSVYTHDTDDGSSADFAETRPSSSSSASSVDAGSERDRGLSHGQRLARGHGRHIRKRVSLVDILFPQPAERAERASGGGGDKVDSKRGIDGRVRATTERTKTGDGELEEGTRVSITAKQGDKEGSGATQGPAGMTSPSRLDEERLSNVPPQSSARRNSSSASLSNPGSRFPAGPSSSPEFAPPQQKLRTTSSDITDLRAEHRKADLQSRAAKDLKDEQNRNLTFSGVWKGGELGKSPVGSGTVTSAERASSSTSFVKGAASFFSKKSSGGGKSGMSSDSSVGTATGEKKTTQNDNDEFDHLFFSGGNPLHKS